MRWLLAILTVNYRNIYGATRRRPNMQSDSRNLLEVSFTSSENCVMPLTFSLLRVSIIWTGLHLELDSEATLCVLGMLMVHGKDCYVVRRAFRTLFIVLFAITKHSRALIASHRPLGISASSSSTSTAVDRRKKQT